MSRKADLSPAEFEIMEILWKKGHATVKEIQAELGKKRKLARTTISTFLTRMRDKQYVEAQEKNFAYEFRPLIDRNLLARMKLDDVVERILGGDIAPLAAYIVDNRNLTPEQLKCMEEIVESIPKEE